MQLEIFHAVRNMILIFIKCTFEIVVEENYLEMGQPLCFHIVNFDKQN